MTDIQPYQFEQEESLQAEDDSDCSVNGESSKKPQERPETITGLYVNSLYYWPRWRQSIWLFSFPPSNLASGAAVMVIWNISLYLWYQVLFVIIIVEFVLPL